MNDSGAARNQPDITQDGSLITEESRRRVLADDNNQTASAAAPNDTVPSGLRAELAATITAPVPFQSNTIAPSPPAQSGSPFASPSLGVHHGELATRSAQQSSPSALRISTDLSAALSAANYSTPQRHGASNDNNSYYSARGGITIHRKGSTGNLQPISRTPSLKTALSQSLGGGNSSAASSLMPSPIISAMGDMTPLPSPLLSADSPGPWKKLLASTPPKSRDRLGSIGERPVFVTNNMTDAMQPSSPPSKRKVYVAMDGQEGSSSIPSPARDTSRHTRNRSVSEYKPDASAIPKRQITVSGSHAKPEGLSLQEPQMRRELNLAESRGLTPTVTQPPTPPPSESSKDSSESTRPKESAMELFEARGRHDNKRRRWRALKTLGQGTFSQVVLATSQIEPVVEDDSEGSDRESQPDRRTLVAVKICEHGPRGGASEERVEMSLKRELEILLDIHHPSLVDLKAFSIEPTRAILVLTYSPGGDLFDVATAHRKLLAPSLLQRIFAELVGAVRYLHEKHIVHRDIKLESKMKLYLQLVFEVLRLLTWIIDVLVNLSVDELADPTVDWSVYPNSIITLTDLGLSRRVVGDEKLETRCGSDDYAAPEVIMGQPYDGRATDAWSLGVLLYALLESRLPFDPHPGMSDAHRMRSRTSHRIARVEWRWVEFAGEDGDHDGNEAKFQEKGLLGAMRITEALLKRARSRWTLDKVADQPWVKGGIRVEGGVRFWEEEEGQEIPS